MSRADRLEELAADAGLDALLVGDLVRPGDSGPDAIANVRWLTGFSGTSGFAVVGPGRRLFLTDFRYTERAAAEVDAAFERVTVEGRMLPALAKQLDGRVGFDDAATSVRSLAKLTEAAGEGTELVATTGLVEELRRTKDEAEIAAIAEATRLADEVFEWTMREHGAEPAFAAIVAAGPNGALPHAEPGEREIGAGELVVIDMGAKLDGYCSDGTRTFASGGLGGEEREAYELVLSSQLASLAAIRAGTGAADADAVSREPIEAAGHGDHYGHGLGHGVGLEVHEAPRLGKTSDDVLAAGDVVTVEPGVYVPGHFGIRIEDLVVVEQAGVRNLSSTPKDLHVTG
jgi:Xaa-Pro aminopeptidase